MKECILIPAHNEEVVLQTTLNSLYKEGFNPAHIYCVDDFSTDDTYNICVANKVNVCKTPTNLGKACAQEYAIKHFKLCDKYKHVIMMDADTKVDKNFRDTVLINLMIYSNVDLFVGQVISSNANHIYSAYRAIEYTFSHEIIKRGQDNFGVIYVAPGCVSIYSTAILRYLSFDSSILTEDMDFTIQVHRLGGKIKYLHDVKVITQDPCNLKDYHQQMLRWSRGFWQVVSKYCHVLIHPKKVDLYLLYVVLYSLVFNRVTILAISLFVLSSIAILLALFIDICIFALIGLYTSYKTKRNDLMYRLPVLYFLSFFNTYVYIRSFFEIIIFRKKKNHWNKVSRYGEDDEEVHVSSTGYVNT